MDDWRELAIEQIAEKVAMGPFGSSIKVETFVPRGVPIISGMHLNDMRVSGHDYNFITENHAKKLTNSNVFRGDVIFTHAGNIGQVAYIPEDSKFERYVISQRQFYMRCNRNFVLPEYITYFFNSPEGQHKLLANASQVGVPSIARPSSYLKSIKLKIPPLEYQRDVIETLGALDDKIDLNRRMNETLEAMARAIFKDWFVDFGPVRAKAEGRPPYLAPDLWALFPDALDDDDKPVGWSEFSLGEVTKRITKGTTPRNMDVATAPDKETTVNFLRVNAITDNGQIIWNKLENIPKTVHLGVLKRSILQEEDVLYTIAGTIGRVSIVEKELLPANTNQAIAIIRPDRSKIPARFLKMLLKEGGFQEKLHANVVQAVQANLSLLMLSNARAVFPPKKNIFRLFDPIENILDMFDHYERESRTLAQLRDLLLPKLMSGEIRLRDADKFVEAVA